MRAPPLWPRRSCSSSRPVTTTKAFITLKVGDEFDVVGTSILCLVSKGSSGRLGIACFRSNSKGAIPGSYFAGIGQDGRVLAGLVDAKR